jgi:hypothetical protein
VFSPGVKKKHRRTTPRLLRPVLRPMAFRVLPRALRDAEWDRRTALHKLGDVCARVLSPVL